MKYGYFRLEPGPSSKCLVFDSSIDLGIRGAGGAVKSDNVPLSVGAMLSGSICGGW